MYIYFCNFTSPMHERTINVINPVPTGTLFVRCCPYIRFSLTRRKMNTNLERTEKGNEKEETAPTGNSLVATCEIFSCACDAYATFCACATFCASWICVCRLNVGSRPHDCRCRQYHAGVLQRMMMLRRRRRWQHDHHPYARCAACVRGALLRCQPLLTANRGSDCTAAAKSTPLFLLQAEPVHGTAFLSAGGLLLRGEA